MNKKTIIYDFDGTLTPFRIPIYPIMKKAFNNVSLINMLSVLTKSYDKHDDLYEWYYKSLFKLLRVSQIPINLENLIYGAEDIKYNPGVVEYFKNSSSDVKQIILTSGLEEFVKATEIYPLVDGVHGTKIRFVDDAVKLEDVVTDSRKSAIIGDITSGDCSNVIYVGDGTTDIPSFRYVDQNGGKNVLLSNGKNDAEILKLGIIHGSFKADFTSDSNLCKYLRGD